MKEFDALPKLGSEALAACIGCGRLMLEMQYPLFQRVKVKRCGIDMNEVRRHVGLAQSMAPGRDGLNLAEVLGPKPEPVVVMDEWEEANVCHRCSGTLTADDIMFKMMARAEAG